MVLSFDQILAQARHDPHYVGRDNVSSTSTWIPAADGQSEVFVPTSVVGTAPADEILPSVLKMFVQLSGDRFYLTPDGYYNSERPAPWQVYTTLCSLHSSN